MEVPENVLEFEPAAYWIWNADTRLVSGVGCPLILMEMGFLTAFLTLTEMEYRMTKTCFRLMQMSQKITTWMGLETMLMHSFDANETKDTDNDGVGDNGDAFPNDPKETADSDGDGVGDNSDAFPEDANETVDSDSDGVGDNSDVFPNDENESADSDGDAYNADAFPNNPS